MKAVILDKPGSINGLVMKDVNQPTIKDDELLVEVHAVGLNPSDYQTAEFATDLSFKMILGLDVAGKVVKVGRNVKKFKEGDRVFYLREISNPYGGFAEYAVTPERFACKIPDNLTDIEAATMPGAGLTAYHIIYQRLSPTPNKTIFIQGGAGGVGSFAIQLAKLCQQKVITTCESKDINYVKSLGADEVIDFKNENVHQRILDITKNEGVDYIINILGSNSVTKDISLLKFGGEIAVTSAFPHFDKIQFYSKGLTLHEIAFGIFLTYPNKEIQDIPAKIANELSLLMSNKKIKAPLITKIDLSEISSYLQKIKNGYITGKVVAVVDSKK